MFILGPSSEAAPRNISLVMAEPVNPRGVRRVKFVFRDGQNVARNIDKEPPPKWLVDMDPRDIHQKARFQIRAHALMMFVNIVPSVEEA